MALTEVRAEGGQTVSEMLSYWQSHIPSPSVSLAVVTSSVEPGLGVALESVVRQGVTATAVIVDPTSFGAREDPGLLLSRLQRRGVPTYLLRKGEDMAAGPPAPLARGQQHRVEETSGARA